MDNKRNIIGLVIVITLSMLWLQVVWPWLAKRNNWKLGETPTTQPAPAGGSSVATTGVSTTNPAGLHAAVAAAATTRASTQPVGPVVLGSTQYDPNQREPQSPYPIGLTITPRGAAVASVTLNRFREQSDQPSPYVFQKPYDVASPLADALATRSISIDGGAPIDLSSLDWQLASPTPALANASTASFSTDVLDGTTPLLRITKTYEIRPANDKTAGYEVLVSYAVADLSGQPHTVRIGFNGPNTPKPENNRDIPELVSGFDGGRINVDVHHSAAGSIKGDQPVDVKAIAPTQKLLWSGMSSVYFNAIVLATDAAGAPLPLADVKAQTLTPGEKDPQKQAVAIEYQTGDLNVQANRSAAFALHTFFGPKARAVLKNDYYSAFPRSYDSTLVLTSSCYSLCTWGWLINILVGLLQGFHWALHDWGLAIIGLVLLVRLILHPVTKSSQVSMSRMTKMGPEMERLKKKYGDDTEGLKKAQVEFYREQGIAPFLGCLPMFLQMPIWIALWSALQSTFEIRHAPFLRFGGVHLTWIHDLAQPDRLIALKHPFDLLFLHIDGLNLLPILMGVVFFINQKLQPQPVMSTDPAQQQQQKMMQWMSVLMFPLFLYSSPSGLNLYIFTSTLIGIFESKRIRAHIKEKEEREKSGVVIIDAPPTRRANGGGGGAPPPAAKTRGIAGFMAKLQNMAEEMKKEQERQQKKKPR